MNEEAMIPEVLPKEALVILHETGVEKSTAEYLEKVFSDMFTQAKKWVAQADAIKVTDASQVREMKMARELRLTLRSIRCDVENKRKAMKADALAKGKAVDGIANVVKALIEPVEAKLEEQEKFAEREEEKRVAALREQRMLILKQFESIFGEYNSAGMDLGIMQQEHFDALIAGMKAQKEQHEERERLAEEARLAEEKRFAEECAERERIRQQELKEANERYEKEVEARRKEQAKADEAARKAKEAQDKADAEIKAMREKTDAENKELARRQAEFVEKQRVEMEKRMKDEEARLALIEARRQEAEKAAQAPDKQKALAFAETVKQIKVPEMKSEAGVQFQKVLEEQMAKFSSWIVTAANAKL